jgi:hypothetical protein
VQKCDTEANMSLNSLLLPEQGLLLAPDFIDKKFLTQKSDHAAKKPRLTSHLVLRTTTTNTICHFEVRKINSGNSIYCSFFKSFTCSVAFQKLAEQDVR